MNDQTYNGWTNYATWRVNLEMIDSDYWIEVINEHYQLPELHEFEVVIREFYFKQVDQTVVADSLASSLAYEFLDQVDWRDIARHILKEASYLFETIGGKVT